MSERVVVMGASPKSERYSYKAVKMLVEYGHQVVPVNPYHARVAGVDCVPGLAAIAPPVEFICARNCWLPS